MPMKVTQTKAANSDEIESLKLGQISIPRLSYPLFVPLTNKKSAKTSLMKTLMKAEDPKKMKDSIRSTLLKKEADPNKKSSQTVSFGRKPWPFDMFAVINFQNQNIHHSRCINAKVNSTVGLGHVNEKTHEVLDPLCETSWQDLINNVIENWWASGNGYIEVVRRGEGERITGLHFVQAESVHIAIEDRKYNKHFEVDPLDGQGTTRIFANFGDKEDAEKRLGSVIRKDDDIQEIIHFKRSSSLNRWYGFPDWISAVAAVELVQAILQYNFEFFLNHGVPEFIAFLTKGKISPNDLITMQNALLKSVGITNQFKSHVFNLPDPNIEIHIEKLAMENKGMEAAFGDMLDALDVMIVSAHGVPPMLAGIQIPGKLGANNELPNALVVFQTLVIRQAQQQIVSTLAKTLGDDKLNGGLGLKRKDFEFKTILDEIDVAKVANTSASRTPVGNNKDGGAPKTPEDGSTSVAPRE